MSDTPEAPKVKRAPKVVQEHGHVQFSGPEIGAFVGDGVESYSDATGTYAVGEDGCIVKKLADAHLPPADEER